jgi:hypothetical protein
VLLLRVVRTIIIIIPITRSPPPIMNFEFDDGAAVFFGCDPGNGEATDGVVIFFGCDPGNSGCGEAIGGGGDIK